MLHERGMIEKRSTGRRAVAGRRGDDVLRHPILLALAPLLLGAAPQAPAAAPLPAPPRLLPVTDVMRHIVNPAAELYWKAAGEVDDASGEHHRVPTAADNARWAATLDAAMSLQESGNLLMMQGRARDDDEWMKRSRQLVDAGATAVQAALSKDEKKTFDAGSALYDACFACHAKYIPRPANSLYKQQTPDDAFKPPM